jgi:hypothetical protein
MAARLVRSPLTPLRVYPPLGAGDYAQNTCARASEQKGEKWRRSRNRSAHSATLQFKAACTDPRTYAYTRKGRQRSDARGGGSRQGAGDRGQGTGGRRQEAGEKEGELRKGIGGGIGVPQPPPPALRGTRSRRDECERKRSTLILFIHSSSIWSFTPSFSLFLRLL